MLLEDKRTASKYYNLRLNYDIVIDNERMTVEKLSRNLGFFNVIPMGKIREGETVYDTEKLLMTGSGIILRKKMDVDRTYFSLIRISSLQNIDVESRERKSFVGECEAKDQPSDFPVQIAKQINNIFNNLFTIDLVEVVKHSSAYLHYDILGHKYKIVSGTGYEAYFQFEDLIIRDMRTGRKAKKRNFSMKLSMDPNYEKERKQILDTIERCCKELVLLRRNRFEIAQVAVRIPQETAAADKAAGKHEKKRRGKKAIEAQLAERESQEG